MKQSHIAIAIFAVVIPFALWYRATAANCPVPVLYRIGEIDASFSIAREDAQAAVEAATEVWEAEVGRDLFVYDESADFAVNFLFDDRQESVILEESQRQTLDDKKNQNDKIVEQIETLQSEFESLTQGYEADMRTYSNQLDAHNSEVNSYNDRGGAPASEFARLEDERTRLATDADRLNATADTLNTLAQEINELSEKGNRLVNDYNTKVNRYNADFGHEREFTQGDYQGDRINVYSFSSEAELIRVLAHEFGHVLGIGHVADPESLMYYLMDDTDSALVLSAEDKDAYLTVCGTSQTVAQRVRHSVRSFLSLF